MFAVGSVDAAGSLVSSPPATNGVVTLCPGVSLSLTCSHSNVGDAVTRWRITGTTSRNCDRLVSHNPPEDDTCGSHTINMVSGTTGSELTSSFQLATVTEALDGAIVECLDGASISAMSVGIIAIQVVG